MDPSKRYQVRPSSAKYDARPGIKWSDSLWGFRVIVAVIIGLAVAGFAFVLPGLARPTLQAVLYAVVSAAVFLALLFLFLVQHIDPGIIPPSEIKDPEVVAAERGQISPDLVIDSHGQWARRRLLLDGRSEITQRYCSTCNVWRQPRTSHCSRCGFCMERFDHHCGAVGTCVARKNHRFFTGFLFSASLASGLLLYATVLRLKEEDWDKGLSEQEVYVFFLMLLALAYFYTSLLFFFAVMHGTILLCDCTTKQYIRSRQGRGSEWQRPSLHVWLDNMNSICCAEVRSKHVATVKAVVEGTARAQGLAPV
ncbi:unnamed protein product [Closterium sp. NIES-54]